MRKVRRAGLVIALASLTAATACGSFLENQAIGTTAGVLKRAQPALQMESDYELAARAIPGTLKTVEGFWNAQHEDVLTEILAEGYCQYGTAFVDDEWEVASSAHELEKTAELDARATKMYTRCLNYGLMMLPKQWSTDLFGTTDTVNKLIGTANKFNLRQRNGLMWVAYALGSIINHNLKDSEYLAYIPTAKSLFEKLLQLDAKRKLPVGKDGKVDCTGNNSNKCVYMALPHIAMGMLLSAVGKAAGGDAAAASDHFLTAFKMTGGKMLLPMALYGYRVGKMTQDKALFRKTLLEVLATNPAIWPEQRLANEVAHRRARRYLKQEKEIFP
jgi:hypothetical protein